MIGWRRSETQNTDIDMTQRFLLDSDYDDQIRVELRALLDDTTNETQLKQAEMKALAQMRMYLSGRYDVGAIFAPAEPNEPDSRNAFIVMTLIDITLYHLWSKERGKMPQVRSDRYQDALDWLKAVGNGREISDLPTKDDQGESPMAQIFSHQKPNNHKY